MNLSFWADRTGLTLRYSVLFLSLEWSKLVIDSVLRYLNIEGLLKPLGFEGILRNTLIFVITALRNHRSIILDCSEVFVKDPLLEWLEKSKEN